MRCIQQGCVHGGGCTYGAWRGLREWECGGGGVECVCLFAHHFIESTVRAMCCTIHHLTFCRGAPPCRALCWIGHVFGIRSRRVVFPFRC